jgi:hypothetical protein
MGSSTGVRPDVVSGKVADINDPKQLQGLAVRLLAFARRRARLKRWWLGSGGGLAKGKTAEDIACEAMASLFGGPRKWDPGAQPDPWEHLKSLVNNLLSNLVRSKENRTNDRDVQDDAAVTFSTPESDLIVAEEEARIERRRARGYELLQDGVLGADDPALLELHDLILKEDIHKPQELAERLNIAVKDVNNLKKRFWRICHRVLGILEKEEGQANE